MPDINSSTYSADQIIGKLKENDAFNAQIELAVDYLSMTPKEFSKVVQDMKAGAQASGVHKIYDTDPDGYLNLYMDDTFTDDTSLIAVNRMLTPKSTPLEDRSLEQAAVNFNKLLGAYKDNSSSRKFNTQLAAGAALAEFGSRLSKSDEVKLLNRAEEINMEFYSSRVGKLRVATSTRADGTQELKDMVFELPLACPKYSDHSVQRSRDLMKDRIFRK